MDYLKKKFNQLTQGATAGGVQVSSETPQKKNMAEQMLQRFKRYDPLKSVKNFDFINIQGTWYEIGRMCLDISNTKLSATTVTFTEISPYTYQVIFAGKYKQHRYINQGVAWPVNPTQTHIQFQFENTHILFTVIYFDTNFNYLLLANQNRTSAWILSRIPLPDPDVIESLLLLLSNNQFNIDNVEFVEQLNYQ